MTTESFLIFLSHPFRSKTRNTCYRNLTYHQSRIFFASFDCLLCFMFAFEAVASWFAFIVLLWRSFKASCYISSFSRAMLCANNDKWNGDLVFTLLEPLFIASVFMSV